MDLKGKIAVVTGGSGGIGKAIVAALAKEGCKVVFTYNTNKPSAIKTTNQSPGSEAIQTNLDKSSDIKSLVENIKDPEINSG